MGVGFWRKGEKVIRKASHKKIIFAGAVLLLAVLMGVFYVAYSNLAASLLEEDIAALLKEAAAQSRDTLTAYIERDLSSLESMAAALGHMEGEPSDPEILAFLRTEAGRDDMVLFYAVASADGKVVSTDGHTGDVGRTKLT